MEFKTCTTKDDFITAQAKYRQNYGRWAGAPADQDAYMDSLAARMAAASAKIGQPIQVRIK